MKFKTLLRMGHHIERDMVVIGGGIAGLSLAYELSKKGRMVTVLSRNSEEAAAMAAAGMLAPQAERLPPGPYLDICVSSREMYPQWVKEIEEVVSSIEKDSRFLSGYLAKGGFLSPVFPSDKDKDWHPSNSGPHTAQWLNKASILQMEPHLSQEVLGGWWFTEDTQVDARKLYQGLRKVCEASGVDIWTGDNHAADSLMFSSEEENSVKFIRLVDGRLLRPTDVAICSGSWVSQLLPVPMVPQKGQMLALRAPPEKCHLPPALNRVLYSEKAYLVPKSDGRVVVGATVEMNGFSRHVTASGILSLLKGAIEVCPTLAEYELEETWAGLRPLTPDQHPVLGQTSWKNLYISGGYWRNGILLAPKGAQLVANVIQNTPLSQEDQAYLRAFAWDRFFGTSPSQSENTNALLLDDSDILEKEKESQSMGWLQLIRPEIPGERNVLLDRPVANPPISSEESGEDDHDEELQLDWLDLVKPENPGLKGNSALLDRPVANPPISSEESGKDDHDEELQLDWLDFVKPENPGLKGNSAREPASVANPAQISFQQSDVDEDEGGLQLDWLDLVKPESPGLPDSVDDSNTLMEQLKAVSLDSSASLTPQSTGQSYTTEPQPRDLNEASVKEQQALGFVQSDDAYEEIMRFRVLSDDITKETRMLNRGPYVGAYADEPNIEEDNYDVTENVSPPDWTTLPKYEETNKDTTKLKLPVLDSRSTKDEPSLGFVRSESDDAYEDIMRFRSASDEVSKATRISNRSPYSGAYGEKLETFEELGFNATDEDFLPSMATDISGEGALGFEEGWWNHIQVFEIDESSGREVPLPYKGPQSQQAAPSLTFFSKTTSTAPAEPATPPSAAGNDLGFEEGWWNELQVFELKEDGTEVPVPYRGPSTKQISANSPQINQLQNINPGTTSHTASLGTKNDADALYETILQNKKSALANRPKNP